MLELENYKAKQSFRVANPVFVRIDGSNLCISYPNGRQRIAKRRYWNDPPVTADIKFIRHSVFNIFGANIGIAPEGLAKNRSWNKKYPIRIELPDYSMVSNVTPVESLTSLKTTSSDGTANLHQTTATKSLDEAPAPFPAPANTDTNTPRKTVVKGDKEVAREDCSGRVFYLYARTSREKEDW
jgi:hypothetical protein